MSSGKGVCFFRLWEKILDRELNGQIVLRELFQFSQQCLEECRK